MIERIIQYIKETNIEITVLIVIASFFGFILLLSTVNVISLLLPAQTGNRPNDIDEIVDKTMVKNRKSIK